MSSCEDCVEVKKLSFEVKGLDLSLQRQKVLVEGVRQENHHRDEEHEAMIQNIASGMDMMKADFKELREDVKADIQDIKTDMRTEIQAIKTEIPSLFDNAVNKLLARVGKWFLIGMLIMFASLTLAWNKQFILAFLQDIEEKVQKTEVLR